MNTEKTYGMNYGTTYGKNYGTALQWKYGPDGRSAVYEEPVRYKPVDLSLIKRGDDIYVDEEWNEGRDWDDDGDLDDRSDWNAGSDWDTGSDQEPGGWYDDGCILYTDQDYDDAEDDAVPDDVDCSSESIPDDVTNTEGTKEIEVPDLISATKVLFSAHKGRMYLYLCDCLRKGWLDEFAGCKVLNRTINREVCDFPHVDYWRIDRENFYADVEVNLKLKTEKGDVSWKGYLVCWCWFEENGSSEISGTARPGSPKKKKPRYRLECSIEDITASVERPVDEYDRLSKYLAPYLTNERVEEIADGIWRKTCEGALTNPDLRIAKTLAEKLGLSIMYCPVYEHRDVDSIVFFKEDALEIGEDRYEKDENGNKGRHIKAPKGEPKIIPANTIVVNTNKIKSEYSAFNIFHECFHFDQHYLFYCLQEMASNDRRVVPTKKVTIKEGEEYKDSIHFLENQANRGGLALMMPAAHTRQVIREECEKVKNYAHAGEMYETAGHAMHWRLHVPEFRIRQRMIQLGNVSARGALNKANRKSIAPFAFNPDSWRDSDHTFIIDRARMSGIVRENEDFRLLIESGRYVYADGHVAKNTPEYVKWDEGKDEHLLTDWGYAHVDQCCLRFKQKYVQRYVGRYVYGRMYYDEDYVRQCEFYLDDLINEKQLNLQDAQFEYENSFPTDFKEALKQLMKKNHETQETLAPKLGTTGRSLREWINDPEKYFTTDRIIKLCLMWKLPCFISTLFLETRNITLNRKDLRSRALLYVLNVMWDQGVDAANKYLKECGMETLAA
ncbi:MAG: helix-turn-helix transcriptional regulator [Blautia sp.]|nr:helix-turn-helix transcriptional regulator [Blautia sp.]